MNPIMKASIVATLSISVSSCESMDPKLRATLAGVACAGIIASVDSSDDRARNAIAGGLACYLGAILLLNEKERQVAAEAGQELIYSDPDKEHETTVRFTESGKSVKASVDRAQPTEIEVTDKSDKSEAKVVQCRNSTYDSYDADGNVVGTFDQRVCRIDGDWYPESEARRILSS